jgi:hypothetical protein
VGLKKLQKQHEKKRKTTIVTHFDERGIQPKILLEDSSDGSDLFQRNTALQQDNLELPIQITSSTYYRFRFRTISICSSAQCGHIP